MIPFTKKIVGRIPLNKLWNDKGNINASRKMFLTTTQVETYLHDSSFAIANVGHKLQWIPSKENFSHWKANWKHHICDDPDDGCYLEDFANAYFYFASLWMNGEEKIILLEMHH